MPLVKREICDEVCKIIGEDFDDLDDELRRSLERVLNAEYRWIHRSQPWNFAQADTIVTTTDDVTDTVDVTNESATVTGTDSVFDTTLHANGDYLFAIQSHYGISAVASATSLTLDSIYYDASNDEATAYIYRWRHLLPWNFHRMYRHGVVLHGSSPLRFMTEWEWNKDHKSRDVGGGNPGFYRLPGTSASSVYSTGTVTISGTAVTGDGTTFPTNATSYRLRIPYVTVSSQNYPQSYSYEVSTRGGATSLTLGRNYYNPNDFTTALSTGTSYELGPVGQPYIGFVSPFADAAKPMRIQYHKDPEDLLADGDPCGLGEWSDVLTTRTAWRWLEQEGDLVGENIIQRWYARFRDKYAQMIKHEPASMDWEPIEHFHPDMENRFRRRSGAELWR